MYILEFSAEFFSHWVKCIQLHQIPERNVQRMQLVCFHPRRGEELGVLRDVSSSGVLWVEGGTGITFTLLCRKNVGRSCLISKITHDRKKLPLLWYVELIFMRLEAGKTFFFLHDCHSGSLKLLLVWGCFPILLWNCCRQTCLLFPLEEQLCL